jgi:hypothetical protein
VIVTLSSARGVSAVTMGENDLGCGRSDTADPIKAHPLHDSP